MTSTRDRLEYLRSSRAEGCVQCGLHSSRNQLVFGDGDPEAAIALCGEGPGDIENRSGVPFTGPSGDILDGILRRVDMRREDLYVLNTVKCHPPGNRNPSRGEMDACAPFLHMQLRIVRPRVLVALGGVAGRYLTGESEDAAVGYLRKHDWLYENETTGVRCPLIVTYHPSYILRNLTEDKAKAKRATLCVMADLDRAVRIAGGW